MVIAKYDEYVKRGAKVHFLSNHSSAPDSASSHLQLYSIITMSTFFIMVMFVLVIIIIIFAIISIIFAIIIIIIFIIMPIMMINRPGKMSKEMARSKQRRWNYSSLAHQVFLTMMITSGGVPADKNFLGHCPNVGLGGYPPWF